jgi:hypothetical protein
MSHGFTLIVTDDTTCPGIEISKLGGDRRATVGGYIHSIPAVSRWLASPEHSGVLVFVLGDDDRIPDRLASRSLTFAVEDSVYRRYEEVKATG